MSQKKLDQIKDEDSLFELMDASINLIHNHIPMAIVDLENKYRCATSAFTNNIVDNPKNYTIGKTANDFSIFDGHVEKIFSVRKTIQPFQTISWLRVHDYASGRNAHIVQETPIINPLTQKIFAIQCSGGSQPLSINHVLHSLLSTHKKQLGQCDSFAIGAATCLKLGVIQEEVLFCLLLGLKGYKFIADFINSVKKTKYTDVTVRNAIKGLYIKFEIHSNIDLLIQKAISLNLHTYIPKSFLTVGVSVIKTEEMPLNGPINLA